MHIKPEIVDVHSDEHTKTGDYDISQQILTGLDRPINKKTLPTLLLYNERGLRLYDDITTNAPEYYLFPAEESILRNHADEIVQAMHPREDGVVPGEVVVELGAGCVVLFVSCYIPPSSQ